MRVSTVIEQGGKTATGIPLPDEVLAALGGGRRPAVQVGVTAPADPAVGYSWRTTLGQMAGRSMLSFGAEHRTASGLAAGAEVVVDIELDTAPRELPLPDDLAQALAAAPAAAEFFAGLAPSSGREWVRWVEEAEAEAETRTARTSPRRRATQCRRAPALSPLPAAPPAVRRERPAAERRVEPGRAGCRPLDRRKHMDSTDLAPAAEPRRRTGPLAVLAAGSLAGLVLGLGGMAYAADPAPTTGSGTSGVDQTATEQTATEQTATEQTATEQTATDQTATDQTATDQAATDQAATDEPCDEPGSDTTDAGTTDGGTTGDGTTDSTADAA